MDQYRCSNHRKRRSADSVQILSDNLDKIMHGLQKCLRVMHFAERYREICSEGRQILDGWLQCTVKSSTIRVIGGHAI